MSGSAFVSHYTPVFPKILWPKQDHTKLTNLGAVLCGKYGNQ